MKKALLIMLLIVGALFGTVFFIKLFIGSKERAFLAHRRQIATITAAHASTSSWQSKIQVTGSLRSVKGVDVTTELAGMIDSITFKPGAEVKKGDLLVTLNIKPDIAKLHQLEANAVLAKVTYQRNKKQFHFGAVSRQTLDNDLDQVKSTTSQVAEQKATINKKVIRAPFAGRLGISAVDPGEYINPGQKIVTLQTLNPIYVDFFIRQQDLGKIKVGQTVLVTLDRVSGKTFQGKITTINPIVDQEIRNAEVEATLLNPEHVLLPGMFCEVTLDVGARKTYITLPYSAVTFNPFGALVFLLKKTTEQYHGKPVWKAKQSFVSPGDTRGDQVAITQGIKKGDYVVTSGQIKLRNDSLVVIDNTISPLNHSNANQANREK